MCVDLSSWLRSYNARGKDLADRREPSPRHCALRRHSQDLICKIEDTERTPRFDFDSANLSGTDREVLLQVAHCLTTGPLRGHGVELVGRADPRGELEYNMTLGTSRAAEVDKYLTTLGVNPLQLSTTSRGELDATGTDESGWQRDRRVDMRLSAPVSVSVLTQDE